MMDRYTIYHDMFDAMPRWLVVDRTMGSYDRDGSDRHVASCPDPEMAQRIADLLNGAAMFAPDEYEVVYRAKAAI